MFLAATICFFRLGGAGSGKGSDMNQFFPEEDVEPNFFFTRVFLPSIDDEGGVSEGPVADGFIKPLKGLGVGNPNRDFFPVLLGQFLDPRRKKEIVLPYVLGVFIEVLVVPFVLQPQTQLVCDTIAVKSSSQKTWNQGNDFEGDRFHAFIIGHRGTQINKDPITDKNQRTMGYRTNSILFCVYLRESASQ